MARARRAAWSIRRAVTIAGLLAASGGACAKPTDSAIARNELVSLVLTGAGDARTVRLDPAVGARINALLPPTIEFSNSERLRLTSSSLTADSNYFMTSPSAPLGRARGRRGVLRASVCPASVRACLFVELPLVIP